jgi:hypothetical protein
MRGGRQAEQRQYITQRPNQRQRAADEQRHAADCDADRAYVRRGQELPGPALDASALCERQNGGRR